MLRTRRASGLPLRLLTAGLVLLSIWASTTAASAADDDAAVQRAIEAVLDGGRIQQEMPSGRPEREPEPPREPPAWLNWLYDLPDGIGEVVRFLMWAVIVVVGVLVASFVLREVTGYGRRARLRQETATEGPAAEARDREFALTLSEADRLAAASRFAEAIHVLLLCCLGELKRQRQGAVLAPSLTSREILARLSLAESASAAFAAIVGAVELSHFGGRPAGAADYDARRTDFQRFAAAFGGAA